MASTQRTERPAESRIVAARITIGGPVQGFGIRPTISRLANSVGVAGTVYNAAGGVVVEIEGTAGDLEAFGQRLQADLSRLGVAGGVSTADSHHDSSTGSTRWHAIDPTGRTRFVIGPSRNGGDFAAMVPSDRAVCQECLDDVANRDDRRFGYPFTTCTRCGPRYSIIESMPYDRERTAMARFVMCEDCRREYESPSDRRFHSQTNGCPQCGPRVWAREAGGEELGRDDQAIVLAVEALRAGRVVGLRGVGGYQWLADAADRDAVDSLRQVKRRPDKPLAVMVVDMVEAERIAVVTDSEQAALSSPANPIVVLARRSGEGITSSVHGDLDTIGVMLPSTPLHDLVIRRFGGPLVVTSGNFEGEPIAFESCDNAAIDVCLEHDRPILRPIDDSVVRVIAGREATIRLGRGLAPLPLEFPDDWTRSLNGETVLAVGGHQKAAIAWFNGTQAALGLHVGDLDNDATRRRFVDQISATCRLYDLVPECIAHDSHPDYYSSRWAVDHGALDHGALDHGALDHGAVDHGARILPVQHHHAHVVATMIQERWLDRSVLGVAWDGTGLGDDGTIWGGEFLVADAVGYRRVASLLPFTLVGGEMAIRQPWRVAVDLVLRSVGAEAASKLRFDGVDSLRVERLLRVLVRDDDDDSAIRPGVTTTSAGRLFDGVAAILLGIAEGRHDGRPAMSLESICDDDEPGEYPVAILDGDPNRVDWRPMIAAILSDRSGGVAAGRIAMRFHRSMARAISRILELHANLPATLSGGCFQNRRLVELIVGYSDGRRPAVATPGEIPTGDGGLAAGQLGIAIARMGGQCGWRQTNNRDNQACV